MAGQADIHQGLVTGAMCNARSIHNTSIACSHKVYCCSCRDLGCVCCLFPPSPALPWPLQDYGKQLLWRHGYVWWCSDNVWRMCAHQHHPSPAFRNLMQPSWQQHTLHGGPYVDIYLMWPQAPAAHSAVNAAAAALAAAMPARAAVAAGLGPSSSGPLAAGLPLPHAYKRAVTGAGAGSDSTDGNFERTSRSPQQQPQQQLAVGVNMEVGTPSPRVWRSVKGLHLRRQPWVLCFSRVLVQLSGRRRASVAGLQMVVPDNAEQLLQGGYMHSEGWVCWVSWGAPAAVNV